MKSFWNDQLHPEANKFQDQLTRVLAAKLTCNLTEQQKINIAVALHVGKIEHPSYDFRDFDSSAAWKVYNAWNEVMRHQPKWACKNLTNQSNKVAAAAASSAVEAAEALVLAAAAAPAEDAEDAAVPGIITTAAGSGSQGSGGSESVTEDASVASVAAAPTDPCSASSRKRGGYPGRNKAKNGAKKEKLDEKKEALLGKKQEALDTWMSQMKEQTEAAKKHASSGAEISTILKDSHELAAKKEKKSDLKFLLKLAQKKGDSALFDKYMEKMTKLCSTESDEDDD